VAREPLSSDLRVAKARIFSLRDTTTESFDSVRATADAVLLEFGASRQQNLAVRGRIQKAQPRLRTLFLTRASLWKYRAQTPGFELPREVLLAQLEFDTQSAKTLDAIADRIEGKPSSKTREVLESFAHLEQVSGEIRWQQPANPLEPQVRALMALSKRSKELTVWLDENI